MNEYTDLKHRRHKITESIRRSDGTIQKQSEENPYRNESAEREIAEALYRIFKRKKAEEMR